MLRCDACIEYFKAYRTLFKVKTHSERSIFMQDFLPTAISLKERKKKGTYIHFNDERKIFKNLIRYFQRKSIFSIPFSIR